jgi:xanthine dehydrogenase YagS FAD-binding subunit
MTTPSYARAATLDQALAEYAAHPGAADYIAGGTELVPLIKDRLRRPRRLVDINALPWRAIEADSFGLRVGSLARMQEVADHPAVRQGYPAIAHALDASGSVQIRAMASIGGNLLQRTRCGYFRDVGFPCNKREPGAGCPARAGENRLHAIFGASDQCVATHASDLAVALVALEAIVELCGPEGRRSVPLAKFYRLPGDTPDRETDLAPGELIAAIQLPAAPHAARSGYLKLRDRASFEFALVSAAVALYVADGLIRSARIAMGGIGTIPWRLREAEDALVQRPPEPDTYRAAAALAARAAQPLTGNRFKVTLMQRTLARALEAVGAAEGNL